MGVSVEVPDRMLGTLLLLLVACVYGQDTHYCPDGWLVSDVGNKIECIMLSDLEEKVTKADAEAICAFHEGWLVDMDEGHGSQKNNLVKSMIIDKEGQPGEPGWPGMQYDWMRHEPNDWHSQNCLTYLKDQDVFGFGVYHWNDWDCEQTARFICERAPLKY